MDKPCFRCRHVHGLDETCAQAKARVAKASVAQRIERKVPNLKAAGSSPAGSAKKAHRLIGKPADFDSAIDSSNLSASANGPKTPGAIHVAEWRKKNPDKHKEYMREYQRKRRAKLKEEK